MLRSTLALAAAMALPAAPALAAEPALVQPQAIISDQPHLDPASDPRVLAALRYDTFWQTGDARLARAALAPDFMDRALPPGRPQGIEGPLQASKMFLGAVPDLKVQVRQMIVAADRVVVHLHFSGHFTGTFNGARGQGQVVDFIATDIYRIADGRIAENWHLEDNLTFLQQVGVVRL
jgi:predicted ester cyclase